MKFIVTCSQVAACTIIILQIWSVTALTLRNASEQIIKCEDEEVRLKWEYELNPNEYVDAKTWSYTKNEETILIARWTYKDGPILEPNFKNTVTIIDNDFLIIRNITTKDEGTYTLTLFLRKSSEPTTKLSLNLTVLKPPLTGCCKPTIQRLENGTGLRASLDPQACGTGPFQLKWNNASGTMSHADVLMFLASNLTGKFTVCVNGPSIETCFKGKRESLCQDETIEEIRKFPKTTERNITLVAGVSVGGTVIVLAGVLGILINANWRRIQKYRGRNDKWKFVKDTLKITNDDQLLESLIPTDEAKMDKAMKDLSNCMYVIFKSSPELALEEINKTHVALENSEIIYIDNSTDSGDGGDLMENRQPNPSYAQSFYRKEKLLKLLVVQGELGIGKTAWCRKLVSTWCEAYECQYHETQMGTTDANIQTMKSFPLLFFVSLRNAEKGQTLKNIIKQQFLMGNDITDVGLVVNLDLLMTKCPDKLIFIIHGVDEAEANVDILNEIISETKNSLTILTCRDWKTMQSRCRIQERDYRPMAYLNLKHVNIENVALYAKSMFDGYGYPKDAVKEFMELVGRNNLETFMKETYFVQPLINIWHKSGLLPSNATDVCLCLIEDSLKEKRKLPRSATFNLDSELDRVPKVRGKIFVISYGKVLCLLGKVALNCLKNKSIKSIFHEEEMMQLTNTTGKELTEISIAAKLVSTAPVSDSSTVNKRLCFQNKIIQYFLIAFHLACEGESQVMDIESEEREMIQSFLTNLTSVL